MKIWDSVRSSKRNRTWYIEPLKDKFERKIQKVDSGCWQWTDKLKSNGYGTIRVYKNGNRYAHRVSYELFHGSIPVGMFVCHYCDVRSCVNPEHLYLGTADDNQKHMKMKGRARNGRKIKCGL